MAIASSTQTDEAHEAEVAAQAEIAADVEAAEAPVVNEQPEALPVEERKVKLVPTDAITTYPASVSLVGLEEEIVFTGPSDSAEVSPEVAEQVAYVPGVEVAE